MELNWNTIISALLSSGVTVAIINYLLKKLEDTSRKSRQETKEIKDTLQILKSANQAYLRDRLRQKYEFCVKREYATIDDKDDFEAMYIQYEALGQNGVMTKCHDEFMNLPSVKPKRTTTRKKSQ